MTCSERSEIFFLRASHFLKPAIKCIVLFIPGYELNKIVINLFGLNYIYISIIADSRYTGRCMNDATKPREPRREEVNSYDKLSIKQKLGSCAAGDILRDSRNYYLYQDKIHALYIKTCKEFGRYIFIYMSYCFFLRPKTL